VVVNSGLGFTSSGWAGNELSPPVGTVMHSLGTARGNNRIVLVGVASQENFHAPASVTYAGQPMTSAVVQSSTENQSWAGVYYMLDAQLPMIPGSYPVAVTFSNLLEWGDGIFDVVELKNVHQTSTFVTTVPVDITLDCPLVRTIAVNFSMTGSFVYGITSARNGTGAANAGPAGFVQTLNAQTSSPAILAGMAGYVGPVDTNQTLSWNVAGCWNSAGAGVALHRASYP
jgi:hypothetical protein